MVPIRSTARAVFHGILTLPSATVSGCSIRESHIETEVNGTEPSIRVTGYRPLKRATSGGALGAGTVWAMQPASRSRRQAADALVMIGTWLFGCRCQYSARGGATLRWGYPQRPSCPRDP